MLKKVCERRDIAVKKYGLEMAKRIHACIDSIQAASEVSILVRFRIYRCHELKGDRSGQYAMDLVNPYRLIFTPKDDKTVSVRIEEITDYH